MVPERIVAHLADECALRAQSRRSHRDIGRCPPGFGWKADTSTSLLPSSAGNISTRSSPRLVISIVLGPPTSAAITSDSSASRDRSQSRNSSPGSQTSSQDLRPTVSLASSAALPRGLVSTRRPARAALRSPLTEQRPRRLPQFAPALPSMAPHARVQNRGPDPHRIEATQRHCCQLIDKSASGRGQRNPLADQTDHKTLALRWPQNPRSITSSVPSITSVKPLAPSGTSNARGPSRVCPTSNTLSAS